MTLEVHDFELALTEPLMAMTRRGLRIDDRLRRSMIETLDADRVPLLAKAKEIVEPRLGPSTPRLGLFEEKWRCPCCKAGKAKMNACWACAGYNGPPRKKELLRDGIELGVCRVCGGEPLRVTRVFNPDSAAQTLIVLYQVLKLPKRFNKKKLTADEMALKSLRRYDKSGLVDVMLRFRKQETMKRIFARLEPDPTDERIRTWFSPATETGRLSSAETFLEVSTALQNLPKKEAAKDERYEVRRVIVPEPGRVLIEADLSQAEARVVAALSGDKKLLERWADPTWNIHRWTGAFLFDKAEDALDEVEYALSKMCRHAFNYGMQAGKFVEEVNNEGERLGITMSLAEGKELRQAYLRLSPSLERWWRRVLSVIDRTGMIVTALGRRRMFFGRRESIAGGFLDAVHREAIAYEPQSIVADLLNRGMLAWWTQYDPEGPEPGSFVAGTGGGRLLAQIHDAVLVEASAQHVRAVARKLKETLEIPLTVNGITFTIPAEVAQSAASWGAMEKMKL